MIILLKDSIVMLMMEEKFQLQLLDIKKLKLMEKQIYYYMDMVLMEIQYHQVFLQLN